MAQLRKDPSPGGYATAGLLLAGAAGAIIGLVVGLDVHAATAWAAMFELGIPAAAFGASAGFLIGCALALARRSRRNE